MSKYFNNHSHKPEDLSEILKTAKPVIEVIYPLENSFSCGFEMTAEQVAMFGVFVEIQQAYFTLKNLPLDDESRVLIEKLIVIEKQAFETWFKQVEEIQKNKE